MGLTVQALLLPRSSTLRRGTDLAEKHAGEGEKQQDVSRCSGVTASSTV